MQGSERQLLSTLVSAQLYFDEHASALGDVTGNGARKKLDTIVAALSAHQVAQSEHRMQAQALTQSKTAARRTLVQDHLAPIANVARAELPTVPELALVRALPHPNSSVSALLSRAENVVKVVVPYAETMIEGGLATHFVVQLQAAIQALADVSTRRKTSVDKRFGATTGIKELLVVGRRQVRVLDCLVRTALRGQDPSLLREWKECIALPRTRAAATTVTSIASSAAPAVDAAA